MTEHYFTPEPAVPSQEEEFTAELRGMSFTFVTDRGVFSRDRVDYGSRLLIGALELVPDATVLDLGCGYGPIGIVAARLVPLGRVYLVDVNVRAVDLARRNISGNGIANAEVRLGDGVGPVQEIQFDYVLTNPPFRAGKATVQRLLAEARAVLKPGGGLWVVAGNKQGAPSLKRFLSGFYASVEDVARQGGFHVLRCVK